MNTRSIFKILLLFITIIILTGCITSTRSYLALDVNNFETGKTIRKGEVDFSTNLNSTHVIKKNASYESNNDNFEINTSYKQFRDFGNINSIIFGTTDRLNLKFNLLLSFSGLGIGPSLKYRLTPDNSKFAASISSNYNLLKGANEKLTTESDMSELFPGSGTDGNYSNTFKVSSKGQSYGIKIPMSYSFNNKSDLLLGLQASWLDYSSEADYESTFDENDGTSDKFSYSESDDRDYFYPGFSLGMRLKNFYFNSTFIYHEDSVKPYFGISLKK